MKKPRVQKSRETAPLRRGFKEASRSLDRGDALEKACRDHTIHTVHI
jgi:hypothetical protein